MSPTVVLHQLCSIKFSNLAADYLVTTQKTLENVEGNIKLGSLQQCHGRTIHESQKWFFNDFGDFPNSINMSCHKVPSI